MKLRSFQKILALGVAACLLLTVVVWLCVPNSQSLAKRILGQIETAEDSELPALLNELADLDEISLPMICDLLDHDRMSVRVAAHREIGNLMASWRMLSGAESAPRVANLAAILAERVEGFSAFGKRAAVDIAAQLLRFEIASGDADNSKFAFHCESILLVAANIDAALLEKQSLANNDTAFETPTAVSATQDSIVAPPSPSQMTPTRYSPASPRDAETVRPLFAEQQFTEQENATENIGGDRRPWQEDTNSAPAPFAPPSEPVQALSPRNDVGAVDPANGDQTDAAPTDIAPTDIGPTEADASRATLATASMNEDAHRDSLVKQASNEESGDGQKYSERLEKDLVADLSSSDATVTSLALRELKQRGFNETQLDIAEQLASPDPLVRLDVVEQLPTVHGINARRWMIWMTYDVDAKVRDKAVAILATNDSLEVRVRFREMLAGESDPEIRRRLHYWLQSHR